MYLKKVFIVIFIFFSVLNTSSVNCDYEIDINSMQFLELPPAVNVSNTTALPQINAKYGIILDRASKEVLYGKNENEKCKMASTTKIMTAIIVLENSNLEDIVEISVKSANTGGSRLGLKKNDKISVKHLLYGLMLKSGNDAAVALAEHIGGDLENFAQMMNTKAKELNLLNTNFVTPHGLDNDNHYTTAYDLAILSDYALQNPIFSEIVKTTNYTVLINNIPKDISNTNELLGNFEGIYGIKTGFTNGANRCLVTSCKRDNKDFICIVLGCDTKKDRTNDTVKLLNYAFENFTVINLKDIIEKEFNNWLNFHQNLVFINKGKSQNLQLSLDENDFTFSSISINNSEIDKINIKLSFNSYFEAPLRKNTPIGKLVVFINKKQYYAIDVLSNNEILKKNLFDYLLFFSQNYCCFLEK